MSTPDIYVEALRRLCDARGGPAGIAAETGLSAENIKQILKRVQLPSGNPRGVGPSMRKTLTEHYPNWIDMHKTEPSDHQKRPSFTSNDSTVITPIFRNSTQKVGLIPVTPQPLPINAISWERLMVMILEEGLDVLESGLWVEIGDDSMAPEMEQGDKAFLVRGPTPKAGNRVLVREASGDILLREYRVITSKIFEAVPLNGAYGSLRSDRDGLEILAVRARYIKEDR